jgi:hypothetical protein
MLLEKPGRRGITRKTIIALSMVLGILVELTPCRSGNEDYLNIFEIAWKKVNETYFDPTDDAFKVHCLLIDLTTGSASDAACLQAIGRAVVKASAAPDQSRNGQNDIPERNFLYPVAQQEHWMAQCLRDMVWY